MFRVGDVVRLTRNRKLTCIKQFDIGTVRNYTTNDLFIVRDTRYPYLYTIEDEDGWTVVLREESLLLVHTLSKEEKVINKIKYLYSKNAFTKKWSM